MENERSSLVYPFLLILGGIFVGSGAVLVAFGKHHYPTWVQVCDALAIAGFMIILGFSKIADRQKEGQIR